jgi:FtsP/CotA-like multicopper oxidase with cupredoxin domain
VNSQEFVLWDPAFQSVKETKPDAHHDIQVDEFLLGQTTLSKIHPFLVNGQITPNFDVGVNEVLHLRALCGTIENENTFIVYRQGDHEEDWEHASIPFYVIASDGVTYDKPMKRNVIVMAGGQREELLLQFDEPGTYVISQQGIQGMQFFDMYGHPHDQLLATITVDENRPSQVPTVSIEDMVFTPGYGREETIQAHDIVKTETIVFSMGANRDQAPFPQYYINGKAFAPDRLDFYAEPGQAVEYILMNANHNVHPVRATKRVLSLSQLYIYPSLTLPLTCCVFLVSLSAVPYPRESVPGEGNGVGTVHGQVPRVEGTHELS